MDSHFDILDAFIDGERVDTTALKRALAEPEGRDYLVDAWLLREGVQEDMIVDTPLATAAPPRRATRSWLIAAAAVLCVLTGYLLGYRAGGALPPTTATPSPVQAAAPPVTSTPAPATSFPVPAPTKVIQVDFASTASGGD